MNRRHVIVWISISCVLIALIIPPHNGWWDVSMGMAAGAAFVSCFELRRRP